MLVKLKIPVLFHTKETEKLQEADIEYSWREYNEKEIILYDVIALEPVVTEEDEHMTYIHTPNTVFLCRFSIEEIEELIEKSIAKIVFL